MNQNILETKTEKTFIEHDKLIHKVNQKIKVLRTFLKVHNKYFTRVKFNEQYSIVVRLYRTDLYIENNDDEDLVQVHDFDIDELNYMINEINKIIIK